MEGEAVQPALGVLNGPQHVAPGKPLVVRAIAVRGQASVYGRSLRLIQEAGRVGIVVNKEISASSNHNGQESFEDEDPSPPIFPHNAAHEADSVRENATERPGQRGSAEEERYTELAFSSLVPHGEIVNNAWEEARLSCGILVWDAAGVVRALFTNRRRERIWRRRSRQDSAQCLTR